MRSDRRRGPRYPWVADAEVTETAFRTRIRAQTRDLSIGGCFVNLHNPLLEGAEVGIRISRGGTTFTALGTVVSVIPNMGMDVAFKTIEPTQSAVLQEWLAGLG
jgi:PilZ domain